MKTTSIVLAGIFGLFSMVSQCQETEMKPRNLEQRTWPAVSNGMVFVDGEFLLPPYIVSRVKNAIYINGKHVGTPGGWPTEKKVDNKAPTPPPHDPAMPPEITKNTTKYDNIFIKYISDKRRFLFETYGEDKGIDMMVDVYKSMPFIKTADRDKDSPTTILVTWKEGYTTHVGQVQLQRSQDNGTPEQAAKMFDGICEIYYSGLEFNDYFMFGNVTRMGTQDGYGQFLVPIAEAMKTAKDEAAFVTVMTNKFPMVTGFSEKAFRSFYKHKDKLPQWEPLLQKRCRGRQ